MDRQHRLEWSELAMKLLLLFLLMTIIVAISFLANPARRSKVEAAE